jgi:hypothetical protein
MAKLYGGAALQIGSALIPGTLGLKAAGGAIKALTPYVATGLGGGLYELGQGIMEGDKAPELLKKTGIGAGIGAGVGAVAGKALPAFAKSKAGQAIGNQASKLYNSFADTKIGQKVSEIAPKVEDLLMTDIKAFNPFKKTQTVYHGSPADFNKFSNEAIGTGEGAQAHGYGHYTAKSKDVADERYRKRLVSDENRYLIDGEVLDTTPYDFNANALIGDVEYYGGIDNKINRLNNHLKESEDLISKYDNLYTPDEINADWELDMNYFNAQQDLERIPQELDFLNELRGKKISKNQGQLYKLSIPKDDVMLREDYSYNKQPQKVKKALDDILNKQLKEKNIKNLGIDTQTSPGTIERTLHTYKYYPGTDAGHIYDIINNNNNATEIFNNAGIKGISYNGGIDGEARVIFNPDDIEIVRKYYNQPSLGEMLLKKSPNAGATSNYLYDLMIRE